MAHSAGRAGDSYAISSSQSKFTGDKTLINVHMRRVHAIAAGRV
jgi:hypothetical protein